jgi:hypothetical protein
MTRERHGIEQVLYVVDWFRGLGGLALLGFIGVAAIYAGGWQGWALGAAFLGLAVGIGAWWWAAARRPTTRRRMSRRAQ